MSLTAAQKKHYQDDGYGAPIDIFSKEEANEIRKEIEYIEKKWPNELEGLGRNYIHLISPVFDKICHHNKVLDAVESVIGKNILVCGTTLFVKNPEEKGFVSFHQDAKYIGLEPYNWVTAWVAVTDANEENGCMLMWPGSHKENLSLHHPAVVHGSGLNKSNDRRIGFVIQSYIGSNVSQVLGKMYVQQARGDDKFKHHEHVERPFELMNSKNIQVRNKANEELSKIFYTGSKKIGKY